MELNCKFWASGIGVLNASKKGCKWRGYLGFWAFFGCFLMGELFWGG